VPHLSSVARSHGGAGHGPNTLWARTLRIAPASGRPELCVCVGPSLLAVLTKAGGPRASEEAKTSGCGVVGAWGTQFHTSESQGVGWKGLLVM
jgi:hypothetical protein